MIDPEWKPEQGRSVKLAILVPSGDQWDADFCLSLIQLQRYLHYRPVSEDFDYMLINERGSLIAMQREHLVTQALKREDVTHLLFLDSDMQFPPDTFHRLLKHGLPMVAGNYVKRTVPSFPNSRAVDGKMIGTSKTTKGLEEAGSTGFGCLLVERGVFEKIQQPWFDTVWLDKREEGKGFEMMGEDVFFFRKARHVGGIPLFIDHDLSQKIGHVGTYVYENWMCETAWEVYGNEAAKKEAMA